MVRQPAVPNVVVALGQVVTYHYVMSCVTLCKINTFVEMNQELHRSTFLLKSTYTFIKNMFKRQLRMVRQSVMLNAVASLGQDVKFMF